MQDDIESTIGDTIRHLVRPQTPAAATGVLRLACLHDDNGILSDAARSIGFGRGLCPPIRRRLAGGG